MKNLIVTILFFFLHISLKAQFSPESFVLKIPNIPADICKEEIREKFIGQVSDLRDELSTEISRRTSAAKNNTKGYNEQAAKNKMNQQGISASTPITLMSRDNFVRYYGALSSSIFSTWMSQEGIKAPDDLLLVRTDKPGAKIDITVTIAMNEMVIDYVVQSENSKSVMNIQWQYQLFTVPSAN